MSLLDIIFLAIALAMDCFAVSIVSGVILKSRPQEQGEIVAIARMAFLLASSKLQCPCSDG